MIRFFIRSYLFLSSFVLIFIIIKFNSFSQLLVRKDYLIICLILILFIFFFYFATKFTRQIQEYIVIIVSSIILTLYICEGYLYFNNSKKSKILDNKMLNNNYDQSSLYQIYQDKKKINNKIVLSMSPIHLINNHKENFFPISGISNSETIHCNENGYYSLYQSDRYGFNNPDKEWDSKSVEYLLVGDSFTHGACVNRPYDITSKLREFSKKSALNLGYSGNGPLIEYATLREYFVSDVKKVIWLFWEGNDNKDLINELKIKILNNYIKDPYFTQNLKFKQNEIDSILLEVLKNESFKKEEEENNNFFYVKILKFIKLDYVRKKIFFHQAPVPNELKKIFKLANEFIKINNSKLYFVYLPSFERYRYQTINFGRKHEIKEIIDSLNIDFIDIDNEVFRKEKNPLKLFPFEKPGHYTEEGYNKVALKIYENTK